MLDRFLSASLSLPVSPYCLAAACILIASKLTECDTISADSLCAAAEYSFLPSNIRVGHHFDIEERHFQNSVCDNMVGLVNANHLCIIMHCIQWAIYTLNENVFTHKHMYIDVIALSS